MLPFQERKKFRQILYSKATLFVILVVLVFVARGAWKINEKATIARAERDQASRLFAEIGLRTRELEASLVKLKSEQGIEDEIRQKFTVAREWEEVVVVVDENTKKSKNDEVVDKGFWARFLGFWKE